MSTDIIPKGVVLPAYLTKMAGAPSAIAAAVAGGIGGGADYPRISIKSSRFRIVEDGVETVLDDTKLSIVIVGANPNLSKTYYEKQWRPGDDTSAPDCYSMNAIRPAADATSPQSELCATCKWNAWGSKITESGQEIKACADQKRLAVVSADDPTGPVYLLQVTPAALKGLSAYQKELSMRGIPVEVTRTVLSFDTDASFPKLQFKFGGFLDEADFAELEERFGSDEVLKVTGEVIEEEEEEQSPPPRKAAVKPATKPAVKAKPKPAPVEEEEEIEEAEEAEEVEDTPAPKRGFGAKAKAAPAEDPAPKRGFGAKAKAAPVEEEEEEDAPAPKAKPKAAAKPKAKPAVTDDSGDLAAEISGLLEGMDDDD